MCVTPCERHGGGNLHVQLLKSEKSRVSRQLPPVFPLAAPSPWLRQTPPRFPLSSSNNQPVLFLTAGQKPTNCSVKDAPSACLGQAMLRAFFGNLISSSSSRSIRCVAATMMSQRLIASPVRGAANQARLCPALPAAAAAHRLQVRRLWQVEPLRRELHSTVVRAAAEVSDGSEEAADQGSPIYQAEYDPGYVCFSCITGTVGSVGYVQGADGSPWLRFTLRVPTPHSDSFTTWHCLASGSLADQAKELAKEGSYIQVSGTYLVRESLQKAGWEKLLPQPAIFAESLGYFDDPGASARKADHIMLPPMSGADLDAFINSGGQQLYAPGQPAPPAQPAAAPITVPGMPSEPANDVEAAWMSVFLENHLWVDQRDTKVGKQPDFRMPQKVGDGRKDALWLTDRQLPAWVKRNLQLLPGGVPFPMPSFIPPEASSGSPKEQQWVEVFTNLPAFWDNRLNKFSPRSPDFAPKDKEHGGMALWIEDRETPGWVVENLDKLPPPPAPRK